MISARAVRCQKDSLIPYRRSTGRRAPRCRWRQLLQACPGGGCPMSVQIEPTVPGSRMARRSRGEHIRRLSIFRRATGAGVSWRAKEPTTVTPSYWQASHPFVQTGSVALERRRSGSGPGRGWPVATSMKSRLPGIWPVAQLNRSYVGRGGAEGQFLVRSWETTQSRWAAVGSSAHSLTPWGCCARSALFGTV